MSELSDKLKVPENHVGLDESIRQKKHFLENKPHGLSYEEYLENQSPTSTAQPVVEKTGPSPFDGMPFLDDAKSRTCLTAFLQPSAHSFTPFSQPTT